VSQVDRWKRYPSLRVWMLLSLVLIIQANATSERTRSVYNAKRIKGLIEELKKQMAIPQEIEPVFVPKNELIVSVQPVRERPGVYQISFEEDFLNTLDDGELREPHWQNGEDDHTAKVPIRRGKPCAGGTDWILKPIAPTLFSHNRADGEE